MLHLGAALEENCEPRVAAKFCFWLPDKQKHVRGGDWVCAMAASALGQADLVSRTEAGVRKVSDT